MSTLGTTGVFLPVPFTGAVPLARQREAAVRLERAGYGTIWTNETVGGKDALVQLAVLLAATERVAFATGIANIWAREPEIAHGGAALLADAFPGRFALGLGVGYAQQAEATGREYGSPVETMRNYLSRMDGPMMPPAADAQYPRILGANGPKMLALAAERADGVLPAGLPPEFTAEVRKLLGPDKLVVVALTAVPGDREHAKAAVSMRLGMPWFTKAMARLGYSTDDVDGVVDATVAYGGPESIGAKVREHLAAGADHVTLMPVLEGEFLDAVTQLEHLAPALP
ncbi:putative F420-dependent oxidoreductase [Amycolatopsis bartoniae]|uniref:Luciferase-like domain-containing protein n=1 Tax=Amycolatopsis bartoniae TaxID=941986 RepID=A0A8H9J0F4_9PSEU|nr:LLM class flavin-dependent oxidoreductase [Amycolatopsis bartoniae]MBB2936480.1 putative F420-dependent oxidoreductase [Amycolatopsis bartoniae]TVT11037.1 LLM class flavin-dependent oxidoreductase [Amycolatopsis bartoniae]GHF68641.1 hypothetical protein GCM10017566_48100 [Amycolatopsis bartoniae]